MSKGCDYSWERPDLQALHDAGYTFVSRYLGYDTTGKNLTATEAQRIHAAGMSIMLNFEYNPRGALNGFAQGQADAAISQQQSQQIGAPTETPIYFSLDWNVQPPEMASVYAYLDGAASVLGRERVGVYGGLAVVSNPGVRQRAAWLWQTYAWSSGQWADGVHVRQVRNGVAVAGSTVDDDMSMLVDFGQWAPVETVSTPPVQEGDPLMGWQTCGRGNATFDQTKTVQGLLLARGYTDIGSRTGLPDGSWGDHTDASVRRFQADHHVANSVTTSGQGDGQVGPNTLRALNGM